MPNTIPPSSPEVTVSCNQCDLAIPRLRAYVVRENDYCEDCYESLFGFCSRCDSSVERTELTYLQWHDEEEEEVHSGEYCPHCLEIVRQADRRARTSTRMRPNPTNAPDLVTTEPGEIIKSIRPFGVELESIYNQINAVSELHKNHPHWGYSNDGSLRTNKNGVGTKELISPILQGKAGEEEIKKITKNAQSAGFFVNTSCGFHLHLDAEHFRRDPGEDRTVINEELPEHEVYYEFAWNGRVHNVDKISDVPFVGDSYEKHIPYKTKTRAANREIVVNDGQNFRNLQKLWYSYLVFDDVLRGMQPPARRTNTFCKTTDGLYSPSDIVELRDYGEMERLWYKVDKRRRIRHQIEEVDRRKRNKDQSRYVGFNLEPVFRTGKTIEIRYHSPTLNAEKILRWADIHQTIFDYVAMNGDISEIEAVAATETHLLKKAKMMCRIFKIRKETEEYMIERLHKFNKLNVDNLEMQDEEVSVSEIGQPYHRGDANRPSFLTRGRATREHSVNNPFNFAEALETMQAYSRMVVPDLTPMSDRWVDALGEVEEPADLSEEDNQD